MSSPERSLEIPEISNSELFSANNACPTIRSAARLLANNSPAGVIDLSSVRHLKPYQIAIIAAITLNDRRLGRSLTYCPPRDERVRNHLERLRLPGIILDSHCEPALARKTNLPIQNLLGRPDQSFGWETTDVLISELGRDLPAGVSNQIACGIDEMVLNAATHAYSEIGCIVVGQAFPQSSRVEVAVLDLGITIRGHLSRRFNELADDATAIQKAMEDGVTGTIGRNRYGEPNSGAGLANLAGFLASSRGRLTILSGSAIVCTDGRRSPRVHRLNDHPFGGTLVNITFATDGFF